MIARHSLTAKGLKKCLEILAEKNISEKNREDALISLNYLLNSIRDGITIYPQDKNLIEAAKETLAKFSQTELALEIPKNKSHEPIDPEQIMKKRRASSYGVSAEGLHREQRRQEEGE